MKDFENYIGKASRIGNLYALDESSYFVLPRNLG
jgi:hypothetical protein